ncbi:hypothetical protein ACWGDE_20390 [Streptomyces sp. NPDC054956]
MRTTPRRIGRIAAVGALSAVLLTGGVAVAASPGSGAPGVTAAAAPSASPSKAAGEITFKATPTAVKAGEKVTFTGRTKGLPIGTKVVLQHKYGSKWTTLRASTTVKQGSSYSFDNTFRGKGKEELRVTAGDAVSPTVTVTVN